MHSRLRRTLIIRLKSTLKSKYGYKIYRYNIMKEKLKIDNFSSLFSYKSIIRIVYIDIDVNTYRSK